ncbi:MAG TPA: HNH/ENDO VII family nuclease [Oligoflexus sp.]|uniref:HNH/ENDO VII family nuclease n=1 Tax=Oligoflexus sp. TaxID=1971216 RepID=UPI002D3764D9|nr:HNH/ENDO VII family nuclease [Oligoflexus sp.]HYX35273.1 HNH/ENDO VII family nuclease [Oligoflexus sp.]
MNQLPQMIPANIYERLEAGATNLDLMMSGNAPIGSDGYQLLLQHVVDGKSPDQMLNLAAKAALIEIEASSVPPEFQVFQKAIEAQFRQNPELSAQYCQFRRRYWAGRAKEILQKSR